jgi:hypothetical protein
VWDINTLGELSSEAGLAAYSNDMDSFHLSKT